MTYKTFVIGIPGRMVQLWLDEGHSHFSINMTAEEARAVAGDLWLAAGDHLGNDDCGKARPMLPTCGPAIGQRGLGCVDGGALEDHLPIGLEGARTMSDDTVESEAAFFRRNLEAAEARVKALEALCRRVVEDTEVSGCLSIFKGTAKACEAAGRGEEIKP